MTKINNFNQIQSTITSNYKEPTESAIASLTLYKQLFTRSCYHYSSYFFTFLVLLYFQGYVFLGLYIIDSLERILTHNQRLVTTPWLAGVAQ